jgi:cytochrome oxidase assembly protein ShyY1
VGYYRPSQEKKMFVPENKPEDNVWYWFDLPAMGQKVNASPFLIYLKGAGIWKIY